MMPGVGFEEMVLLVVVAIIVIGPKDLPLMMRKFGRFTGKMRAMAFEFKQGIDELGRQAELEELQKQWAKENERIMAATRITDGSPEMKPLADETAQVPAPGAEVYDIPSYQTDAETAPPATPEPELPLDQPKGSSVA